MFPVPPGPSTASAVSDEDLSREIAQAIDKWPGERVKCTRVGRDTYRCNWIAPDYRPSRSGTSLETFRVRQSRFLRVVRQPDGLVIEDQTAPKALAQRLSVN